MQRLLEEVLRACHLDEAARIHHRDALAGLRHNPHVVGDEDDRQAKLAAKLGQELEDLVLHRHVERRRRLVRQDDLRRAGKCRRDDDALAHAAAEGMRIIVHAPLGRGNPDEAHQVDRAGARLGTRTNDAMLEHGLADLPPHRQHWVERRDGVLHDHRDPPATDPAQRAIRHRQQVLIAEHDAARGERLTGRRQPQDRAADHAFAGAAFADQSKALAFLKREGNVIDDGEQAARRRDLRLEVGDGEHGRHRTLSPRSRSATPSPSRLSASPTRTIARPAASPSTRP